jgi:hypothetical protein
VISQRSEYEVGKEQVFHYCAVIISACMPVYKKRGIGNKDTICFQESPAWIERELFVSVKRMLDKLTYPKYTVSMPEMEL